MIFTAWYYLNEVYPPLNGNHRPLDPPQWWMSLFGRRQPIQENELDLDATAVEPVANRAPAPAVEIM